MSKRFRYSRSGQSLRSFAEISSNPVAFDMQSFDNSAKTCVGVVSSKTIFLSISVRNSSKDLLTSVTSQLRPGPISVKKEFSISAHDICLISRIYPLIFHLINNSFIGLS